MNDANVRAAGCAGKRDFDIRMQGLVAPTVCALND
jgi:hypothetical protein